MLLDKGHLCARGITGLNNKEILTTVYGWRKSYLRGRATQNVAEHRSVEYMYSET